jgi:hypothetical protein
MCGEQSRSEKELEHIYFLLKGQFYIIHLVVRFLVIISKNSVIARLSISDRNMNK